MDSQLTDDENVLLSNVSQDGKDKVSKMKEAFGGRVIECVTISGDSFSAVMKDRPDDYKKWLTYLANGGKEELDYENAMRVARHSVSSRIKYVKLRIKNQIKRDQERRRANG